MRSCLKILCFVFLAGFTGCVGYSAFSIFMLSRPVRESYVVHGSQDSLFVKWKDVGWTGSNDVRWITSNRASLEPTPEQDIIFQNSAIFFKSEQDTLIVYTRQKQSIPPGFTSSLYVEQIELGNPEFQALFRERDDGILTWR